ncbi:hypothetical protein ACF0H5_001038 [Mactra antiquata]
MDSESGRDQASRTTKRCRRRRTKQGLKSNDAIISDDIQSKEDSETSCISTMNVKSGKQYLSPSEIRYSQSSISCKFSNGTNIGKLLDDIVFGHCLPSDIPIIVVTRINNTWVSADNRRLWIFKQLELLSIVETIRVKVVKKIYQKKLTSGTGGQTVAMRGYPEGQVYAMMNQYMPDLYPVKDRAGDKKLEEYKPEANVANDMNESSLSSSDEEVQEVPTESNLEFYAANNATMSLLDNNDIIDLDGGDDITDKVKQYSNELEYSDYVDSEFKYRELEYSKDEYSKGDYRVEELSNDKINEFSAPSDHMLTNKSNVDILPEKLNICTEHDLDVFDFVVDGLRMVGDFSYECLLVNQLKII